VIQMKLINVFGLAVVVTAAAIAFGGVGSASADVLCMSEPVSNACPAGKTYGGELTGLSSNFKIVGPFGAEVVCIAAFGGETIENIALGQVILSVNSASVTSCNHGCNVTVVQISWRGHAEATTTTGDGKMWMERNASKSAGNDPGFTFNNCQDFPFNVLNGCTYKATQSQPAGFAGEGVELTFNGDAQPTVTVNATFNAGVCGNATISATYLLTPKNLWIANS
jgi:hypothetical protein